MSLRLAALLTTVQYPSSLWNNGLKLKLPNRNTRIIINIVNRLQEKLFIHTFLKTKLTNLEIAASSWKKKCISMKVSQYNFFKRKQFVTKLRCIHMKKFKSYSLGYRLQIFQMERKCLLLHYFKQTVYITHFSISLFIATENTLKLLRVTSSYTVSLREYHSKRILW